MTGGQLNADVEQYLQAAAANTPPPTIVSDPVIPGATPVEQWMALLAAAANLSDAEDNAISAAAHSERDAKLREAAEKFAAQDEQAAAELRSIAAEPYTPTESAVALPGDASTMAQQFPQMASGLAGAVAGAIGGALQPLLQLPQQAAQGMQQAMQTGMGLLQQMSGDVAAPLEDADFSDFPIDEDFDIDPAVNLDDDIDGLGGPGAGMGGTDGGGISAGGSGLGSFGGTAPTAYLGPPPVPPSSASTAPSSARITSNATPPAVTAHPAVGTGMAGMPLVPPGALGAAGSTDKDEKSATKRVSIPPVLNGAPVQGRLSVAQDMPPVTKNVDGKPVVTRRIVDAGEPQSAGPKPGS